MKMSKETEREEIKDETHQLEDEEEDGVNDTNMKNIKDFEMKYGDYDEVSQGIRIDRDTYIAGLISELKKGWAGRRIDP